MAQGHTAALCAYGFLVRVGKHGRRAAEDRQGRHPPHRPREGGQPEVLRGEKEIQRARTHCPARAQGLAVPQVQVPALRAAGDDGGDIRKARLHKGWEECHVGRARHHRHAHEVHQGLRALPNPLERRGAVQGMPPVPGAWGLPRRGFRRAHSRQHPVHDDAHAAHPPQAVLRIRDDGRAVPKRARAVAHAHTLEEGPVANGEPPGSPGGTSRHRRLRNDGAARVRPYGCRKVDVPCRPSVSRSCGARLPHSR